MMTRWLGPMLRAALIMYVAVAIFLLIWRL